MSPEKSSGSVPPEETPPAPVVESMAPDLRREEYTANQTGWIDESSVALLGIQRGRIGRRLKKAPVAGKAGLSHAALVYRDAAESSLNLMEPKDDDKKPDPSRYDYYDPLAGFEKTHMTRRPAFGEVVKPIDHTKPVEIPKTPTSILQEQAAIRANLRVDALHRRRLTKEKFELIYGDYSLNDKKALKTELADSNLTGSQKRAITKASNQVRRANRSSERIDLRLHKSKYSQDLPGRATTSQVNVAREKAREKSKQAIRRTGTVIKEGASKVRNLSARSGKAIVRGTKSQSRRLYRGAEKTVGRARKWRTDRKTDKPA